MIPVNKLAQYIQQAAAARGIDPGIALRVARSEGLAPGVWQSNVTKSGVREPSYGPFQLLVGGPGTGFPTGMGNAFIERTGLDPRDPSTVKAQVDFALDQAKQGGWSPWYGAKAAGIAPWEGIGGKPSDTSSSPKGALTSPGLLGSGAPAPSASMTPEEAKAINDALSSKKGGPTPFQSLLAGIAEGIPNPSPPRAGSFPGGPSAAQANGLLKAALAGPTLANLLMSKRV